MSTIILFNPSIWEEYYLSVPGASAGSGLYNLSVLGARVGSGLYNLSVFGASVGVDCITFRYSEQVLVVVA